MPQETAHYINLTDIIAIRLECGKCGRAVIEPVNRELFEAEELTNCPVCRTVWRFHSGTDPVKAVEDIKRVAGLAQPGPTGVTISLQVDLADSASGA